MMGHLVMRKVLRFLSVLALASAGVAGSASAQPCGTTVGVNDALVANDSISVNTTWGGVANPSPICLEAPIFVQEGFTLTILPGTVVRGQPRRAVAGTVAGSPGALIVTQGAKLISDGSASAPIVYTTAAVDNDANGVCDNFDAGTFGFDVHPGYDPASLPALVPDATPTFCDDTPTTAPMPPLASDGTANVALWGGVVINGYAPTNLAYELEAPGGYGMGSVEGLALPGFDPADAQCGGVEPHDTSGVIRYSSVRHAGDEIGNSNELNGFTLCAVGDNTIFEFNEVYANFDDAFEWFGGTMHANHLMLAFVGDDGLDIDWGYTGSIQFALHIMPFFDQDSGAAFGSASGDKLAELDGDDYNRDPGPPDFDVNMRVAYSQAIFGVGWAGGPDGRALASDDDIQDRNVTPWPLSAAYISNYTGIGSITDGANPAANSASANTGVQMRHGFAGQVVNSLFVNVSTPCLAIDTDAGETATGHDMANHQTADLTRMVSSSCDGSAALAAAAGLVADNGDAFATFDTAGATCGAVDYDNIRSSGGGFTGLVDEDPNFNAKSFAGGGYDPRPLGPGADCGVTPKLPGLDRAATYRGAFVAGQPLWTDGWTTLDQAGAL